MSFVRRRGRCTTLVETYRDGTSVKQRIINLHGQDSIDEAVQELERRIAEHEQWLEQTAAVHHEPMFYIEVDGKHVLAPPLFCIEEEDGRVIPYYSYPTRRETRECEKRAELITRLREKRDRLLEFTSSLPAP